MGACFGPFLGTSMPVGFSTEEHLKALSDFVRLHADIAPINELLNDGTMAIMQNGFGKATDEVLYEIRKPTTEVLQLANSSGSAPYSLLDLLEGFHVLVPSQQHFRVNDKINISNGAGDFYDWDLSLTSYQSCIQYLKDKMKTLANDNADYWEYCDYSYDKDMFRNFYKGLIEQLEVCETASVIFIFGW